MATEKETWAQVWKVAVFYIFSSLWPFHTLYQHTQIPLVYSYLLYPSISCYLTIATNTPLRLLRPALTSDMLHSATILCPYLFELLVACEAVECSACVQHVMFILLQCHSLLVSFFSDHPFSNALVGFFFFFPTQCQCHLDWVFHFLTFLSLRFVLSISPFEGRTFRERERAQPLSLAQTFMLFHILSLCKHYCYFLEMTSTFFCNNLSLLFPNTVPVFKLGAFWVSVGWLRCSYSVFSEKSCLPLFPQSNVTPVSLYDGISSWRAGINQQWNVSPSIGQGT